MNTSPACFRLVALLVLVSSSTVAQEIEIVPDVERQPLAAAARRLVEAMNFAGTPLPEGCRKQLELAQQEPDATKAVKQIQEALDPLCLVEININAESRVKVKSGPVAKTLVQQGWRTFLVKIHNEAGVNPELRVSSPNAAPVYRKGKHPRQRPNKDGPLVKAADVSNRWLELDLPKREPFSAKLSGLKVEYKAVSLFSRDVGKREASLAFDIGQGTQDIGFRNAVPILFDCQPATSVKLNVFDEDGSETTAAFVVKDERGRVYPNPAKRLAPDFFFHHQVYRHSGESLTLPPGKYNVTATRGPEYQPVKLNVEVPERPEYEIDIHLKRWIHIAKQGWYSGDHHVHAAGCAHYDSPTEGVGPDDMMRHLLGEDLNVGCVLSWGPCWYAQKEFFDGQVSKLSTPGYLMRYDVEVSGFPSSHAGHLCLLNLTEDDYPGTTNIEQWPSWTLPVLKWGMEQNGVVGYSHSGWGLALPDIMPDGSRKFVKRPWGGAPADWKGRNADVLPDYAMPPFDGIGANEFIVTTALGVCDFISAVDTPAIWELNIWYHTLNCGMTTRISGETDFPCIYGDRVGLGRIYVQLEDEEELTYERWIQGLKDGRSYCCDGLSHILDLAVDGVAVGTKRSDGATSRVDLKEPKTVTVTFNAAALLEEEQTDATRAIRNRRLDEKPYWHIERCRINDTRTVPVELIVNGEVAARRTLVADGQLKSFSLPVELKQSSWVAVRILPSAHTNPIFVHIGDKPIHSSRKSAEWCAEAVRTCWTSKQPLIREEERKAAESAYQQAEQIYLKIAEGLKASQP